MTAHQDVAGVVERLRGDPNGNYSIVREEAATLIESLSKALGEAEALAFQLNSGAELQLLMKLNNELLVRAEVAESRLAEAMKVIEPFATEADAQDRRNPSASDDLTTVGKFTIGQCRAARRFLNAGKE